MIHIENGDFEFDGNNFEVVKDLGIIWFMLESNPDWWYMVLNIVLPSLIQTKGMDNESIEFLTEIKSVCDKYPNLFDKGGGDVWVGKLKFEGEERGL